MGALQWFLGHIHLLLSRNYLISFNSMHLGGCIAEAPFPIVETLATIMKSEKQKKNAEDEVSVIVICSPLN